MTHLHSFRKGVSNKQFSMPRELNITSTGFKMLWTPPSQTFSLRDKKSLWEFKMMQILLLKELFQGFTENFSHPRHT